MLPSPALTLTTLDKRYTAAHQHPDSCKQDLKCKPAHVSPSGFHEGLLVKVSGQCNPCAVLNTAHGWRPAAAAAVTGVSSNLLHSYVRLPARVKSTPYEARMLRTSAVGRALRGPSSPLGINRSQTRNLATEACSVKLGSTS